MTLTNEQVELTNWSKTARSTCSVYKVNDLADILETLATARAQGLSVIPHGGGHSYTDAALNTGEIVMDLTPMRKILSWDPLNGIMRVEPGVTLQEMIQVAWEDGWWPVVSPSTPQVTVGGCVAMNVNGRNAWKSGPFGAYILSLDVLLVTGEVRTLMPEREPQLFHAFVGSLGLLGIITSITVQLQRLASGSRLCQPAFRLRIGWDLRLIRRGGKRERFHGSLAGRVCRGKSARARSRHLRNIQSIRFAGCLSVFDPHCP